MTNMNIQQMQVNPFFLFIITAFLVRILTIGSYPLMDTTEARYGEIARIMYETGDWITPYFDYGVPFWGKPPLSFWLSALSFKLLGVNEFAVRLPSIISSVITVWILSEGAKKLSPHNLWIPGALIVASPVFYVVMGGIMTEPTLMLGISLSVVAFIRSQDHSSTQRGYWPWLFFIGLAIGMLSKGPVMLIFIGLPLVLWAMFYNKYNDVFIMLPWFRGSLLFIILVLPWYIAAESKTPGFIDYFIIGEHINRFLVSGWQGDLYGSAHKRPRGTIWLYFLIACLPWLLVITVHLLLKIKRYGMKYISRLNFDDLDMLLILWAFIPLLFFTFAGNILATYALPGLPSLVLFIARKHEQLSLNAQTATNKTPQNISIKHSTWLAYSGYFTIVLYVVLISWMSMNPGKIKSSKLLLTPVADNIMNNVPIYYLDQVSFSARYYSNGMIQRFPGADKISSLSHYYLYVLKDINDSGLPSSMNVVAENNTAILYEYGTGLVDEVIE